MKDFRGIMTAMRCVLSRELSCVCVCLFTSY